MFRKISLMMATSIMIAGFTGNTPENVEAGSGLLSKCPDSPNCVSTQALDSRHSIKPISYSVSKDAAMKKLVMVINKMPRTKIIRSTDEYIQIEFRSAVFRFVDDVEFMFDDSKKLINFRSASRLGYSDLGVNRKRMEEIRRRFMNDMP